MEEEQVIYVVVDENTNQAQQVQIINGQPHLVVQDENGQTTLLDGRHLLVEDENGQQMLLGGGSTGTSDPSHSMIVMQEDGTPVVTDTEGNIIQQDLMVGTEGGKFILGADGSISLDQLGQVQSITPVTSTTQVSEPAAQKSHPKFVVTSSGLQIQPQPSGQPTTNGSAASSCVPPQASLLRQAFDNASMEKPSFVVTTPEVKQPVSATITIPAVRRQEAPVRTQTPKSTNGHTIITFAETTPLVSTGLSSVDPAGPGPEFMETDDGGETQQPVETETLADNVLAEGVSTEDVPTESVLPEKEQAESLLSVEQPAEEPQAGILPAESENLLAENDNVLAESEILPADLDDPLAESENPAATNENALVESEILPVEKDNPLRESENLTVEKDSPLCESENLPVEKDSPLAESNNLPAEVESKENLRAENKDVPLPAENGNVPADVEEAITTENIAIGVNSSSACPEEDPKETSMMEDGTCLMEDDLAPRVAETNDATVVDQKVATNQVGLVEDSLPSDDQDISEIPSSTDPSGPSLIINVKKIGEDEEPSIRDEPKEAGVTVVESGREDKKGDKPGLNDSTSSFKTGEYIGNSEDDEDDPADYYQNVDPIDSYLTARDEEDGIPAEPLVVASPHKQPIDYEAVFPSPQKTGSEDSKASDGDQRSGRGRGRPPKKKGRVGPKVASGGASPRMSSASDSEPSTLPLTPSKRSQRQSRSVYRRPHASDLEDIATEENSVPDLTGEDVEMHQDKSASDSEMTMNTVEKTQTNAVEMEMPNEVAAVSTVPVKRGRGRPRKVAVCETKRSEKERDSKPQEDVTLAEKEQIEESARSQSQKQSDVSEVSETDDSQKETPECNFKRVGAMRHKIGSVQGHQAGPASEEGLEEGEIDMSEILGGSTDTPSTEKEEYEPQPGTSREISRSGRQRAIIHYAEMGGNAYLDTASEEQDDSDDSDDSSQPPNVTKEVVQVKRGRGRPRKSDTEGKSPFRTYERRGKEGFSPVKSLKSPVTKSPLAAKTTIGKSSGRFVSDITNDNTPWKGDLASLRKEMEGLRNTNERLQTQLEMTQQSVKAHDVKELHTRIEKLQALNTELKCKLKDAESKSSSGGIPKFSLNLGLFKGPKFDKFTVKKSGSSHGSGISAQSKDNSQESKGSEARILLNQKDKMGAMSKDLKNREQLIEKRELRARTLDQELDDRSCQLKVKEAKLGRLEQKLKSQEKELEYKERNIHRPGRVVDNEGTEDRGRKAGGTERKLRELLAKKERLDSMETRIKEREKEIKASENALKDMKKRIEAKEKELNKREAEVNKKENELQGKDQLLSATEQQLTALGQELSQKFDYLRSKEQNLSSDDEEASTKTKVKSVVKSKGATAQFEKEKDALLQKINDITDKNKTVRSSSTGPVEATPSVFSPRGRGRSSLAGSVEAALPVASPRGRGRSSLAGFEEANPPVVSPRGRGRPRKGSPAVRRGSSTGSAKKTLGSSIDSQKKTTGSSTGSDKKTSTPISRPITKAKLASSSPSRRGRGRPRKSVGTPPQPQVKPQDDPEAQTEPKEDPQPETNPDEDPKTSTPKGKGKGRQTKEASEPEPAEPKGVIRKLHKSEPSTLRLKRKRKGSAPEPVKLTKIRKRSL